MVPKQKVKFLTAIWGERYVNEFSEVSLPSYLAPGNIPALAQSVDLEVLVMTTQDSLPVFSQSAPFRRLQEICAVRFILIDDLIASGVYGVTLTLAYARGIRSTGAEQTETYFVFMNSDFVLADGSLSSLPALMEQTPCIMAASLRGGAEAMLPILRQRVCAQSHQLAIPPREMVGLTLKHLHPTVLAKHADQTVLSCSTNNQLYWRVNDNTLLGRSYLIFMLAIKPEVPMGPINSYCDYGFVPELVPSGRIHVIEDSDQFFMLEMQPIEQEREMLHLRKKSRAAMAKELGAWTTREHRITAQHDTIFHSGDLPSNLGEVRRLASEMVDDLARRMGRAKNHADHYYWRMGVLAWWARRKCGQAHQTSFPTALEQALNARTQFPAQPLPHSFPEELLRPVPPGHLLARLYGEYCGLLGNLRARKGIFPKVPSWHPRWADAQILEEWVATARRSGKDALLVDLGDGQIAQAFGRDDGIRTVTVPDLTAPSRSPLFLDSAKHLLICLPTFTIGQNFERSIAIKERLDEIVETIQGLTQDCAENKTFSIYMYSDANSSASSSILDIVFRRFVLDMLSTSFSARCQMKIVGGKWRGILLNWELRSRIWSMASGGHKLPFALAAASGWLLFCALIAMMNKSPISQGKGGWISTTSAVVTFSLP